MEKVTAILGQIEENRESISVRVCPSCLGNGSVPEFQDARVIPLFKGLNGQDLYQVAPKCCNIEAASKIPNSQSET